MNPVAAGRLEFNGSPLQEFVLDIGVTKARFSANDVESRSALAMRNTA
jgi:hypothetical protein